MRIEYNGQTLSDGGIDGPQSIRMAPSRIVDASPALRAAYATQRDQQGKANVLAWTQERTHASIAAAQQFLLTHVAGLPDGRHDATITTEAGTVHTLSAAVLVPGEARQLGCTTVHSYSLHGGAISGTPALQMPPRGPDPRVVIFNGDYITFNGSPITHDP